jgi:hypothetical protein
MGDIRGGADEQFLWLWGRTGRIVKGMGPFGTYDMAGNVKELRWNESEGNAVLNKMCDSD